MREGEKRRRKSNCSIISNEGMPSFFKKKLCSNVHFFAQMSRNFYCVQQKMFYLLLFAPAVDDLHFNVHSFFFFAERHMFPLVFPKVASLCV